MNPILKHENQIKLFRPKKKLLNRKDKRDFKHECVRNSKVVSDIEAVFYRAVWDKELSFIEYVEKYNFFNGEFIAAIHHLDTMGKLRMSEVNQDYFKQQYQQTEREYGT